jgi:hypothetical protein
MMLGIVGGAGAGFAATSAKAINGNANRACFNLFLPDELRPPESTPLSLA